MCPIILIPARMNSTRLPGKPLLAVGDAPMIVQVWRRALEAGVGEVAVACDGQAIYDIITEAGGKAVITDPELPSGSDRIFDALEQIDPDKQYDVVVNVQGDMPTLDPALIQRTLSVLAQGEADIATAAAPIKNEKEKNDPAVVKAVIDALTADNSGRAVSFSRRMPADGRAFHHIGLYAYRRAALEKFVSLPPSTLEKQEKLEQLRALEAGMRIDIAIVEHAPIGVDTKETLEEARKYYGQ